MSWLLCSSQAAIAKAGVDANVSIVHNSAIAANFSKLAEGQFQMKTRKDWSSALATADAPIVDAVADAVSDLIAIKFIEASMKSYPSKVIAQTMMDQLKDNSDTIIKDLREDSYQKLNK